MILDSCYNRPDHQLEFQIQGRISFLPVLALSLDDAVPDAKTICLFRLQLTPAGRSKKLFQPLDHFRPQNGFSAPKGQMVAASMVVVPRQSNSRGENKSIKNGLNHFGDQNQIEIDVKHKLMRRDEVRPAWVHDRHVWPELRAENNSRQDVWADSTDGSTDTRDPLKEDGYRGHIQPTGGRDKKLTQPQIEANHQPWKTHSRVEPILGIQQMGAGNLKIGTRGLDRAKAKSGWYVPFTR